MNQPPERKNRPPVGMDGWKVPPANPQQRQAHPMPPFRGAATHTAIRQPERRRPKARGILLFIAIAALLAVGGFIGIRALRDRQVAQSIAQYEQVYGPNIFINGIPISGLMPEEAWKKLEAAAQEKADSWNLSIRYRGHVFANLNYASLGLTQSMEELFQLLNEAWLVTNSGSVHDRKAAIDALLLEPYRATTAESQPDGGQLQAILEQIAPYVNTQPVNAAILAFRPDEAEPFLFQEEQPGARLNVGAELEKILRMAARGESGILDLSPELLQPEVTRAQLQDTVALRSSISTPIATSSTENRNHNIRLSFARINGTILKPGQSFSFNDVVGPRTLKAGFAEALEYVYGDLVTGVGGGVCQASTTLYQAILTGGLSSTMRTPHSDKVDYTEMGQDATVYLHGGREIDFRFKNTTPGNIYLTAHVKPAKNSSKRLVAEIRVYGISLGEGVSYRLRSEIVQTIPPPEEKKFIVDKTGLVVTYTDEEKLKSAAQEGKVIETYLEKYVNGSLADYPKLISNDTFRAKPAEYWKGNNVRREN